MRIPESYCVHQGVNDCDECSSATYGRDCHNNEIIDYVGMSWDAWVAANPSGPPKPDYSQLGLLNIDLYDSYETR